MMCRAALLALVAVMLACAAPARADVFGEMADHGTRVGTLTRAYMQRLQEKAARAALPGAKPPFFRYASTSPCATSPDLRQDDAACGADAACQDNTPAQGLGPPVSVWEARVDEDGKPVDAADKPIPQLDWTRLGTTCFPELVPGEQRVLTMAQIKAAFHDTDFALASLSIQPAHNVTLVTLPTYLELRWPQRGFAPDEVDSVDPARMSGFRVDIRPRLVSIVYVYGDGTQSPPTTSLGGPYPDGDIVHEYARAGTYLVRADVTYGGQYRVNGGAWVDIPGQLTIPGTSEPLQVKTATSRLYSNTG